MLTTFKVTKCTANQKGGFVLKLESHHTVTVFGQTKDVKRTHYIGGMTAAIEPGTEIKEDIEKFEIKEYAYAHPETGEMLNLKWLHAKV